MHTENERLSPAIAGATNGNAPTVYVVFQKHIGASRSEWTFKADRRVYYSAVIGPLPFTSKYEVSIRATNAAGKGPIRRRVIAPPAAPAARAQPRAQPQAQPRAPPAVTQAPRQAVATLHSQATAVGDVASGDGAVGNANAPGVTKSTFGIIIGATAGLMCCFAIIAIVYFKRRAGSAAPVTVKSSRQDLLAEDQIYASPGNYGTSSPYASSPGPLALSHMESQFSRAETVRSNVSSTANAIYSQYDTLPEVPPSRAQVQLTSGTNFGKLTSNATSEFPATRARSMSSSTPSAIPSNLTDTKDLSGSHATLNMTFSEEVFNVGWSVEGSVAGLPVGQSPPTSNDETGRPHTTLTTLPPQLFDEYSVNDGFSPELPANPDVSDWTDSEKEGEGEQGPDSGSDPNEEYTTMSSPLPSRRAAPRLHSTNASGARPRVHPSARSPTLSTTSWLAHSPTQLAPGASGNQLQRTASARQQRMAPLSPRLPDRRGGSARRNAPGGGPPRPPPTSTLQRAQSTRMHGNHRQPPFMAPPAPPPVSTLQRAQSGRVSNRTRQPSAASPRAPPPTATLQRAQLTHNKIRPPTPAQPPPDLQSGVPPHLQRASVDLGQSPPEPRSGVPAHLQRASVDRGPAPQSNNFYSMD